MYDESDMCYMRRKDAHKQFPRTSLIPPPPSPKKIQHFGSVRCTNKDTSQPEYSNTVQIHLAGLFKIVQWISHLICSQRKGSLRILTEKLLFCYKICFKLLRTIIQNYINVYFTYWDAKKKISLDTINMSLYIEMWELLSTLQNLQHI